MPDTSTIVGHVQKDLLIEEFLLKWPLTIARLDQREQRTRLRQRESFQGEYNRLWNTMLTHDVQVLAKWLQRKLFRQKAIPVNEPELSILDDLVHFDVVREIRIVQQAIKYDEDAWEKFRDKRLMVPPGQRVVTITVMDTPVYDLGSI